MKIFKNFLDIVEEIKRKKVHCIVIDGVDGAGKSTLAHEIGEKLSLVHINLDDYLEKNRGSFVEFIKYDHLKKVIEETSNSIIIEGVCALEITGRLQIECDTHIYVQRMSAYGFWNDSELFDINENVDDFIAKKNAEHREFCEAMAQIEGGNYDPNNTVIPRLTEELIRYHHKFNPHKIADIIFERIG